MSYQKIADRFRAERAERIGRTEIDPKDFEDLAAAGFLRLSVPEAHGGTWQGIENTGPIIAEILRNIARGDPSVALVAAMHPAVVAYWHPHDNASTQAQSVFTSVLDGHWWGTMMSEPGSGGDVQKTTTQATKGPAGFELSGEKHFGSGSGQTSFMVTTARLDDRVELFVIDMRNKDWNGNEGLCLLRAWNGHGMTGTQSHAFTLSACNAERAESDEPFEQAIHQTSRLSGVLFSAVMVGILDEAFETSLAALEPRRSNLRALEQVELVRAHNEHWQAITLYGAARDAMGKEDALLVARRAKYAIARHAENALARLARVIGGSSYSRTSPLGQWTQDVKALGFLRPPWALQNDQLFESLWD